MYAEKYLGAHYCHMVLTKNGILVKLRNIKFHENSFSSSPVAILVCRRWRETHNETKGHIFATSVVTKSTMTMNTF